MSISMSIEAQANIARCAAARVAHLVDGYRPGRTWEGFDRVCPTHTARAFAHSASAYAGYAANADTLAQAEQYRRRAEWCARRAELAADASTR
jgi:hypothetical protein